MKIFKNIKKLISLIAKWQKDNRPNLSDKYPEDFVKWNKNWLDYDEETDVYIYYLDPWSYSPYCYEWTLGQAYRYWFKYILKK